VNNATWAMLNESEKALLREAEPRAAARLDEDALLDLHDRIRRARNKYSKLYRRRAQGQVAKDASRGRAHAAHARTAVKAEAFEDALARVSRLVAKAAKAAADELKADRLAAATPSSSRPARKAAKRPARAKATPAKQQRRTPIRKRASASDRAATRRKQATRGAR
jgi:hypothetical protein